MLLDLFLPRHLRVFSMNPFHLFIRVLHTFGWLPGILILRAAFPFHKIAKLFDLFIPSSNLPRLRNDVTLHDPFCLPF